MASNSIYDGYSGPNAEFNGLPINKIEEGAWPIIKCQSMHIDTPSENFPSLGDVGPLIYGEYAIMATVCSGGTIHTSATGRLCLVSWELRLQEGTTEAALREIFKKKFLK